MGRVIQIPYDTDDHMIIGKRREEIIKNHKSQLDKMSLDEKRAFVRAKLKELYPDD